MGIAAPTTDEILVDVLENDEGTCGGSLNMRENSQTNGLDEERSGFHLIFQDPATLRATAPRVAAMGQRLILTTEEGKLERVYI